MSTVNLMVPSTVAAGTEIFFSDGTSAVVDATGIVAVPSQDVSHLVDAGWLTLGYGVSSVVERASAAQAVLDSTVPTSTNPFGFGETQAQAILDMLAEIRLSLIAAGAWKGSA